MNLNLINLPPSEWSKDDWRDAYTDYCKHNIFGPKTKKEYYDMVLERYKRLEDMRKPTPPELLQQWVEGRRAAKAWARWRGCDMNGRMLLQVRAEVEDRGTREIAERAEDIAVDTMQRLDYIVESIRKRRQQ